MKPTKKQLKQDKDEQERISMAVEALQAIHSPLNRMSAMLLSFGAEGREFMNGIAPDRGHVVWIIDTRDVA